MFRICLGFQLASACLLLSSCAPLDYVPDNDWSDFDDAADFYEDWFGGQLRAAKEPPLTKQDDLKGFSSRFRLLVLPSFDPAFVYRIDETAKSKFVLNYTRLDGAGGYEPGAVAVSWNRDLSALESEKIRIAINEVGFKSARQTDKIETMAGEDGDEILLVCADGTTYIFEHLTRDYRSFVQRHSCRLGENPELLNLTEIVTDFTQ